MPPQNSSVSAPLDVVEPETSPNPISIYTPPTPPSPPAPEVASEPTTVPFEETPEEIPSAQPSFPIIETEPVAPPPAYEAPETPVEPVPQPIEMPAALPPKLGGSIAPVIIVILVLIAGGGLAVATFMSAQTKKLKTQLSEITQTLEKQETTLTPTASPTVFEISTPTTTPEATISVAPTQMMSGLFPLKNASSALQIAINHSPNAQLILIKIDNATNSTTAVTKYFFREDLSTKKYFYVAVTGVGNQEIIDKQIYVTPDDNIPSLNDAVLSNKMGMELDEVIKLSLAQCANQTTCSTAPVKAQYIKTGTGIIWQLSIYTNGLSGTPLMIQINAETKAILYKSPEFANK